MAKDIQLGLPMFPSPPEIDGWTYTYWARCLRCAYKEGFGSPEGRQVGAVDHLSIVQVIVGNLPYSREVLMPCPGPVRYRTTKRRGA